MGTFGFFMKPRVACVWLRSRYPNAPDALTSRLDAQGRLLRKAASPRARWLAGSVGAGGAITPDAYAINTTQPPYQPSGNRASARRRSAAGRSVTQAAATAGSADDR